MITRLFSAALRGVEAQEVEVEVNARGADKPLIIVVGLPDAAVRESSQRVISAIGASALYLDLGVKTVNLAPADLKKEGPSFDLPIALAMVAASRTKPFNADDCCVVGELGLDGAVRPVKGVLSIALEAKRRGRLRVLVPEANAPEAAVIEGIQVFPIRNLREAWDFLIGELVIPPFHPVPQVFSTSPGFQEVCIDEVRDTPAPPGGEFLFYGSEDGRIRLQVRLEDETVWLTQKQMAELFQKDVRTINEHIQNLFEERELTAEAVIRKFRITAADGKSYATAHYNLDVIISVGYRVKSLRGTQFRIWATQRLREYIVTGFAMDDERLKQRGGGNYFEDLLARIRDIRSSEKEFWRKVLEIYATSIDYDPSAEASRQFFATVQNKMHWAAHGHTAAEVIHERVDAAKPQAGLTSWVGARPGKSEAFIAKNYLSPEELNALNRIVVAYLELAELQALNRQPMYMRDWIVKLDDFLRLSGRDILGHAGNISHEQAVRKAELEFEKFHRAQLAEPSQVEKDFDAAVKDLKTLPAPGRKKKETMSYATFPLASGG